MIKDLEDAVVDMLLVLDSTIDTISSLIENYKQFCLDVEADIVSSDDKGFDTIGFALREKHREVLFNRKKVETLQTKVQGMSNLVRKHPNLPHALYMLIQHASVFQYSRSRKWPIPQTASGRDSKRKCCHEKAHGEKCGGCRGRQNTNDDHLDILAYSHCVSQ